MESVPLSELEQLFQFKMGLIGGLVAAVVTITAAFKLVPWFTGNRILLVPTVVAFLFVWKAIGMIDVPTFLVAYVLVWAGSVGGWSAAKSLAHKIGSPSQ